MSEREEEVPELDADAKAFFARHQQTGEPSPEALERVRLKLAQPAPLAPAPEGKPATVTQLPRRRPMFHPEVKAAAAVVILLLGAQAIYLAARTREAPLEEPVVKTPAKDPQVEAVAEAWRGGKFDEVRRLAARECTSAACGALSGELAEMLDLAERVESISDDERGRLGAFDKKLSNGRDSAVRRRLENGRLPPPSGKALATAQALFDEATKEKKAKNFEMAEARLLKCLEVAPGHAPCYRLLGSVYASIATRDQSASDMEKARKYYERFLEVASPDDEYVPKVKMILDAARTSDTPAAPAEPLTRFKLAVGQHGTFTLGQSIARVAVGDPSIVEVKVAGGPTLELSGASPGTTTIMVWDSANERTNVEVEVTGKAQPEAIGSNDDDQAVRVGEGDLVRLELGSQAVVNIGQPLSRIALGDPSIADVKPIEDSLGELLIVGHANGKTTLLVWDAQNKRTSITVEVFGAAPSEDATPADETVTLLSGGYSTLTLDGDIARVAVGDPDIADLNVYRSRELRIEGRKAGKTTVLVWYVDGKRSSFVVEVKKSTNLDDRVAHLLLQASQARARGDYKGARSLMAQVTKLDPQNAAVKQLDNEFRVLAKEFYMRAYQLRDSDRDGSVQLFRQVMELTSPDDELHQKAKVFFSKMQE